MYMIQSLHYMTTKVIYSDYTHMHAHDKNENNLCKCICVWHVCMCICVSICVCEHMCVEVNTDIGECV